MVEGKGKIEKPCKLQRAKRRDGGIEWDLVQHWIMDTTRIRASWKMETQTYLKIWGFFFVFVCVC